MERLIAPHQKKIAPLNECMYCGAKEGEEIDFLKKGEVVKEPVKLSDEHIIPYGLGGTLLFEKSSCQECARITSKLERDVMRGFLYYPRVVGNLPSRKKKDRPKQIMLDCIDLDESVTQRNFAIDDAVSILLLPIFVQPGCMEGVNYPANSVSVKGIDWKLIGQNHQKFLQDNDLSGIKISTRLDIKSFLRLLAKIAYGFYVAQNGLFPKDESPLLPIILGTNPKHTFSACDYIGSDNTPNVKPESNALHLIYDTENKDTDCEPIANSVSMQLFADGAAYNDGRGKYIAIVRIRSPVNAVIP